VVLAGTNRVDILDKALLRPGRFDRLINIDLPDLEGRTAIFKVHLKKIKLGHDMDDIAKKMAALTPGFSGADIANVCNEAAIIAARKSKEAVELEDFEAAIDRVIGGLEKKASVLSKQERRVVAYHEAGHAVAGWFLEHADPLLKVTIVPRSKGALGFAQYLPKEIALYQEKQLFDMMVMTLAGRASEQLFFGQISTGAADDLKKITKIAQNQVMIWGMSKSLPNLSYPRDEEGEVFTKPFSEQTAAAVDAEVQEIVRKAYARAQELIEQHKHLVEKLAEKLLEVETVNHDMLVEILGPRPYVNDSYAQFLKGLKEEVRKKAPEAQKDNETTKQPPIIEPTGGPALSPA